MPPRQSVGVSGSTKKPIDSIFTPYCSMGTIMALPSTSSL